MTRMPSSIQDEVSSLSEDREELLKLLLERQSSAQIEIVPVPRDGSSDVVLPMSWAQERLWFIDQLGETAAAYYVQLPLRLHGALNELALEQAIIDMLKRHEVLRTVFAVVDGIPKQKVRARAEFRMTVIDLTHLDACEREAQLAREKEREAHQRFDLGRGPLIRGTLLRLHAQERVLLLTMHHIVADGWSLGVIWHELSEFYSARCEGRRPKLTPLAIQYADYASWQRRPGYDSGLADQERYWSEHLRGVPDELNLPADRGRSKARTFLGANVEVSLDRQLTAALRVVARQHRMTLFMLLYAALAIVLSRLSGQRDLVIGTPVANRRRSEVEALIGFLVNSLPIRVCVSPEQSVQDFLAQVRRSLLSSLEHQDIPFERIVSAVKPERSLGHNPLFQVMLALQNTPRHEMHWPHVRTQLERGARVTAHFDLLVALEESDDAIGGVITYASDLFEEDTIRHWSRCFVEVLRGFLSERDVPVGQLPVVPEIERARILEQFNPDRRAEPSATVIHELFERQVRRIPSAPAVIYRGEVLTYAELNSRANRLARYLLSRGVRPESTVAICAHRGFELALSVLAVMKAGAAYLPVDPEYPTERVRAMIEDAQPHLLLADSRAANILPSQDRLHLLEMALPESSTFSDDNLPPEDIGLTGDNLLYVIYTSGSTGRPKGTGMPHRAMVNLIEWQRSVLRSDKPQRVLQFAALSFDVAFQEILSTLCSGDALVMLDESIRRDVRALASFLKSERVTRLFLPPLMVQSLAEAGDATGDVPDQLADIITAGEQLRITPQIRRFFSRLPQCRLHNHYGPTETHVVTALTLGSDETQWPVLPSIGRPVTGSRIYILDEHLQPVPIGAPGEIYIGGVGIARGYLSRPALTAQRFIPDPFGSDSRSRMYRTGDVARWRCDGTIEYLGRNDHQVKIRGFRIELGEIESQLVCHPRVKDAAVLAAEVMPGDRRLIAYVTLCAADDDGEAVSAEELRAHLKATLPDYMIPSAFVVLDRFPLTQNGKLDRGALPKPQLEAYASRQYDPPQGETELILADIWRALLQVDRIGRNDNFFELGGHSLLIIQMLERLRRAGLTTTVASAYGCPVLAELAGAISRIDANGTIPENRIPPGCEAIEPAMLPLVDLQARDINRIVSMVPGGTENIQDIYPLTALQEGMLFHHLLNESGIDVYARSMLFALSSRQEVESFVAAVQAVIDRHDILRTSVLWEGLPHPVQVVCRQAVVSVEEIALDSGRDPVAQCEELMRANVSRLDLRRAPLVQLLVARRARDLECYAILRTHHMVFDHESLGLLLNEIDLHIRGRAEELHTPVAFREHVAQVIEATRENDAAPFFREMLHDVDETTAPFGLVDVHGDGRDLVDAQRRLPPDLAELIVLAARSAGVSPATLFHVAWALVAGKTSGRADVVFGSVLSGRFRSSPHTRHRTMGMFINALPLRVRLDGRTVRETVEDTQRSLAALVGHEHAALSMAQRCSGLDGGLPLFTSMLNYISRSLSNGTRGGSEGIKPLASVGKTNYPLAATVYESSGEFELSVQADARIDAQQATAYLATAIRTVAEHVRCAPDTPMSHLSILSDEERFQIVAGFNRTESPYQSDEFAHALFQEHARRSPGSIAVTYRGQHVTYGELEARSNILAHHLRRLGVGPDALVAICTERGLETPVAILGVLKAGGAYLPLDPDYPQERIAYMLADARPRVLLTQDRLRSRFVGCSSIVIPLDAEWSALEEGIEDRSAPLDTGLTPRNLAYVIYTSGSTGNPKGVMLEHRGLRNLAQLQARALGVRPESRVLQFSSPGFDACVWEWAMTLCAGACLCFAHRDDLAPGEPLWRTLADQRITHATIPPVAVASLPAERSLTHLETLIVAGEACSEALVQRWAPGRRFINAYGPTESTVCATFHVCDAADGGPVPIGRPIANTQIFILDRHLEPAPVGVTGEIYIGGPAVARGYLNRPTLTAERFLPDPFAAGAGQRIYRTGDLGRWTPDGKVLYAGRNDHQIKIRGFRVELGEIEAQLLSHAGVNEAVVIVRRDALNGPRLIAYVTSVRSDVEDFSPAILRSHLRKRLPDHMVPAAIVVLDRMPLTPNGKIDRRALPEPELRSIGSEGYEAPIGELEEVIAQAWQGLLGVAQVGRRDNFFELGGHSITATRAISHLRGRFDADIPLRLLFEFPTLQEFAASVALLRSPEVEIICDGNSVVSSQMDMDDLPAEEVLAEIEALKRELRSFPNDRAGPLHEGQSDGGATG